MAVTTETSSTSSCVIENALPVILIHGWPGSVVEMPNVESTVNFFDVKGV